MNKTAERLVGWMLSLALTACSSAGTGPKTQEEYLEGTFSIHVYDFRVSSYGAIGAENIEAAAMCHVMIPAQSAIGREIGRLFSNVRSGKFHDGFLRMKTVLPDGDVVLIDVEGGVLKTPDNSMGRLDETSFAALKAMVQSDPEFSACNQVWEKYLR